MPSYPTSVKSFTTRNTGDVIQAAHVNDLQDEVNAIEGGLLNGTAPLNSSRSTVATLSVTGGSTLAGTLNVTGNSTLSELFVAVAPPLVKAYNSTTVAVANNALTNVTFDTDDFVYSTTMHPSANPGRLVAPSSGLYLAQANVIWNGAAAGNYQVIIRQNGNAVIGNVNALSTIANPAQQCVAFTRLQAAEYVELYVLQNTGTTGSLAATTSTGRGFSDFVLQKIR